MSVTARREEQGVEKGDISVFGYYVSDRISVHIHGI